MIKDSGERTRFDTGAVRDMHTGKGRMDLLPWEALVEVSKHCEEGALKYGERNCEKGIPIHSLIDSAFRHLAKYMMGMKDEAIVCNIGHFDNEIDMAWLESNPECRRTEIKPQVDKWTLPSGRSILVLAEGRLVNLGCATGHASFVMSNSFTNQTLAQIKLAKGDLEKKVYTLPKELDEEVARLHLARLGVKLTTLTQEQADYIGVPVEGPYKADFYRY